MRNNVSSYIMPTYGERSLEFKEGKGSYLISKKNKKYLDFGSGIAVNSLGHCHPALVDVLKDQAEKLWHTSNLYYNSDQEEYAKILCNSSFAEKIFFTNSGAEAIEAGLKVVRSFHHFHKNTNKKKIITFKGAFHGRTFAGMSAQNNEKYSEIFRPLISDFITIPFNDLSILEKTINENTAAILIEPIQGEGGIRPADLKFLENTRKLCNKTGALLFLDEVQSGFGRSGKLFSYEWTNCEPDIMATAKGIASGFPLGACFATNNACVGMTKGMHGSTYGGNPLAISVGREVINIILKPGFLENVDMIARFLWKKLKTLEETIEEIVEIRGAGLLLGIKTKNNNLEINKLFQENGLLCVPASDNIIRISPPLTISKKEVEEAIHIISKSLK